MEVRGWNRVAVWRFDGANIELLILNFESLAIWCPGVVALPAEAREALAELGGDGRRQPCVHVFETALPGVALGGGVQREQPLPSLARRAGARIEQQAGSGGEAQKRGADTGIVLCVGLRGVCKRWRSIPSVTLGIKLRRYRGLGLS